MASSPSREPDPSRDLIVLVADSNTEYTIKGLLSRPESLRVRPLSFQVLPHPERDPGCFLRAPDFLRPFRESYHHALVLLDHEGSGRDATPRQELEADLEKRLATDWQDRAAAVVLDPELEVWLWSDSPEVDNVLGWKGREPDLRSWLAENGFLATGAIKPARPKEAVEQAAVSGLRKMNSTSAATPPPSPRAPKPHLSISDQ